MNPNTKGYILYGSIYKRCLEETEAQRQKVEQWLPGFGDWGGKQ